MIVLTREGLKLIKTAAHVCKIETIWIGGKITADIAHDLEMLLGKRSHLPSLSYPLSLPGLPFLTNKNVYFKYPFEMSLLFHEARK